MDYVTSHRAVVTGIGVIAPGAVGVHEFWKLITAGEVPFSHYEPRSGKEYRATLAGVIDGDRLAVESQRLPNIPADRCALIALVAARLCLEDTSIGPVELCDVGLVLSTTSGGWTSGEQCWNSWRTSGNFDPASLGLLCSSSYFSPEYELVQRLKLGGPSCTLSAACASGTMAVVTAGEWIRAGRAQAVLAGGCDVLAEAPFAAFNALRITSPDACRPFDKKRNGTVLSEGSTFMLLENRERAIARGARIYAEVIGGNSACDAYHMTRSHTRGLRQLFADVSSRLSIDLQAVDYVNCHGTGTISNDAVEASALEAVFADRQRLLPVSTIKGVCGHLQGTSGAIEAAATALSIFHGVIPRTHNLQEAGEFGQLDFVAGRSRSSRIDLAVSHSLGFGGVSAAVVLRKDGCPTAPATPVVSTHRRVALTAVSALSPMGAGTSALFRVMEDPSDAGRQIDGPAYSPPSALAMDRLSRLVVAVCRDVLKSCNVVSGDFERSAGIALETFYGSQATTESILRSIYTEGPDAIEPLLVPCNTYNASGTFAALELGLQGPNSTFAVSAASGGAAVAWAFDAVRQGDSKMMLAGGYDEITTFSRAALAAAWERQCRLTQQRERVAAEGIVVFAMEPMEAARQRNVPVIAEIVDHQSGHLHGRAGLGRQWAEVVISFCHRTHAAEQNVFFFVGRSDASQTEVSDAVVRLTSGHKGHRVEEAPHRSTLSMLGASTSADLLMAIDRLRRSTDGVHHGVFTVLEASGRWVAIAFKCHRD